MNDGREIYGVNSYKQNKKEEKENSGINYVYSCCCLNCCNCINICCNQKNSCICKNYCIGKQNDNGEENNCLKSECKLLFFTTAKSLLGIIFSIWIIAKVLLIINKEESIITKINLYVYINLLNLIASVIALIIGYIFYYNCKHKKTGAIIINIPDFIFEDIITSIFIFKHGNEVNNYLIKDDSNQKFIQMIQNEYIKLKIIYLIIFTIKILFIIIIIIIILTLCWDKNKEQQNTNDN